MGTGQTSPPTIHTSIRGEKNKHEDTHSHEVNAHTNTHICVTIFVMT